jgi:hypothetical protein
VVFSSKNFCNNPTVAASSRTLAYRTEMVKIDPWPGSIRIVKIEHQSLQSLCYADRNRSIDIECYDYKKAGRLDLVFLNKIFSFSQKLIGMCEVTIAKLTEGLRELVVGDDILVAINFKFLFLFSIFLKEVEKYSDHEKCVTYFSV